VSPEKLSMAAAHAQPASLCARTPALSCPRMRLLSLQIPLARGFGGPAHCARRPQRRASCDRKHHRLAALPGARGASGGPLSRPRGAPLGAGRDRRGRGRLRAFLQMPELAARQALHPQAGFPDTTRTINRGAGAGAEAAGRQRPGAHTLCVLWPVSTRPRAARLAPEAGALLQARPQQLPVAKAVVHIPIAVVLPQLVPWSCAAHRGGQLALEQALAAQTRRSRGAL